MDTIHCGGDVAYCGAVGQPCVPHDRPELATCDRCREVADACQEFWRVAYRLASLLAPDSSPRKLNEFVDSAYDLALRWHRENKDQHKDEQI
jgi:hypothetical protein